MLAILLHNGLGCEEVDGKARASGAHASIARKNAERQMMKARQRHRPDRCRGHRRSERQPVLGSDTYFTHDRFGRVAIDAPKRAPDAAMHANDTGT